jgi:hypothetical protein
MAAGTLPICLAVINKKLPLNEQKDDALIADQRVTGKSAQPGTRHNAV